MNNTIQRTPIHIINIHTNQSYACLCQVIAERKPDNTVVYEASSPDEAALVAAARVIGYRFVDRTMKTITIEVRVFAAGLIDA